MTASPRFEFADERNVLRLTFGGTGIASGSQDRFVILKSLTLGELRASYNRFEKEIRDELHRLLALTPAGFRNWQGKGADDIDAAICPPDCPIAFRRKAVDHPAFYVMRQKRVIASAIDLGLVPQLTPQGKKRNNSVRHGGHLSDFVHGLETRQQIALLNHVLQQDNDLDDLVLIQPGNRTFGFAQAREALRSSGSSEEAWNALAGLAMEFSQAPMAVRQPNEQKPYAAALFMMFLKREGVLLWPTALSRDAAWISPRMFRFLIYTIGVPEASRSIIDSIKEVETTDFVNYVTPALRDLILTTDFFSEYRARDDFSTLLYLKECYQVDATKSVNRGLGVNIIFRTIISKMGFTFEDLPRISGYFGGGLRLTADNGRDAFGWVDRPSKHMKKFRQIFGDPPDRFPDYLKAWAAELRAMLPLFQAKSIDVKINELNPWLLFLHSMGAENAPRTWRDVQRSHIASPGVTGGTFTDFLRTHFQVARVQAMLATVQQSWEIAATRDGFSGKLASPFSRGLDRIDDALGPIRSRVGRTRRQAMSEFLHQVILEENRRPDEAGRPFAFARELGLYDREVIDPDTGRRTKRFWPALPTIVELHLTTGARNASVLWADSGEGDEAEVLLDGTTVPNSLPTATRHRQAGFLTSVPTPDGPLLGMTYAVAKTGAHTVPWVDETTARLFSDMRTWQIRYNPRRSPVLATRDPLMQKYADEALIGDVYPVFRDPDSRQSYPPTAETVRSYWSKLLARAQETANGRLKGGGAPVGMSSKPVSLVDEEGKARFDLHSIRVTVVTNLIENGVSPLVVQMLVGHRSLLMTYHYVAVDNARVLAALRDGHRAIQAKAAAAVKNLEGNWDRDRFAGIVGGVTNHRGEAEAATQLFETQMTSRDGAAYEVFAHGICPGGECRSGGPMHKNVHQPVFRPRACSRCRFRITGPAFLPGLVHRLNALMAELVQLTETDKRLNAQIQQVEDRGGDVSQLEAVSRRHREMSEEIWSEWAAEQATIANVQTMLANQPTANALVTGLDPQSFRLQTEQVHVLSLLHEVVSESDLIAGATIEVPAGIRERRDQMLLDIARQNGADQYLYRLPGDVREKAMARFGDLLLGGGGPGSRDPGFIDRLLDGTEQIEGLPSTTARIAAQLTADDRGSPSLAAAAK
jgi:hypothetical protein